MRPHPTQRISLRSAIISRRTLIKSALALAGSAYLSGCSKTAFPLQKQSAWPHYLLRRPADELFFDLTAVGYREVRFLRHRHLELVKGFRDPKLIFRLPPQHFAETAIGVTTIPATLPNSVLALISLVPSRLSSIVFRVPDRKRIDLKLEELLAWNAFELVRPDLNSVSAPYDLTIPDTAEQSFTRIEMPWGIDLTPLGSYGKPTGDPAGNMLVPPSFAWEHSTEPIVSGDWIELWTTALKNIEHRELPVEFEVLDVRGFQRDSTTGSAASGNLVVAFSDIPGEEPPDWLGYGEGPKERPRSTPLRNFDRVDIATSLSRRFPYSGRAQPDKPGCPIDTASIKYVSKFNPQKTSSGACYTNGRTIPVDQFRLSARGGWVALDTHWKAEPGCGLSGWTHSSSLGRDQYVKTVNAGFLYPFGIEAEVVTVSERAFVRDEAGHFVAILIKQAFVQVPQPNRVDIPHAETTFRSLSITTKSTPPLDLPSTGHDPAIYREFDFFLPSVDGRPFEFEHTGIDWAGDTHTSKMPMYFVSNRTLSADGLIWEPGLASGADCKPNRTPSATNPIPTSDDGLRVVDKEWNKNPYRFANYGGALVSTAKPLENGDTSQRLEWAEWVRGGGFSIPRIDGVAARPFLPRVRTMKIRLQGMSQFSGETRFSLATYRDTRFTGYPLLDPEPTSPERIYLANVPSDTTDPARAFLFLLETRDLIKETGKPVADPTDETTRKRIRAIYYGSSMPSLIPDSIFASIDNEIQFGLSASSESTGGLSVPDTHVSTLTRRFGPVGDATFNERRWIGYNDGVRAKLQTASRLDYAAFRLEFRSQLDKQPFEKSLKASEVETLARAANNLMRFAPTPTPSLLAFDETSTASLARNAAAIPSLNLGDLFGADAQVLPGLSFADIFKQVAMRGAQDATPLTSGNIAATQDAADPFEWKFKITGIDWLLQLLGSDPGQLSFSDLISIARSQGQSADTSVPLEIGLEAGLQWSNEGFERETIGPIEFIPNKTATSTAGKTRIEIEAKAAMSLGAGGLPENFSDLKIEPGKAQISSRAELKDFNVLVFKAIRLEFSSVAFNMSADGRKDFSTKLRNVELTGLLEFINQISKVMGNAGNGSGMDFDISLKRIRISQTIRFPLKEGDPLFVGTAQIINLAFGWGVMIPLTGRDVLTVSFALSSRAKPLTIFVPSWYGGKAHILIEVTTRGLRLLEVSMEYGGLVPIAWGVAHGEASLTAGVFYQMEEGQDADGKKTGRIVFEAFVRAAAHLDIAGIIQFAGQILIALRYVNENGTKSIVGEATQSVSVKIGFFRYSYSFTATHKEVVTQGQNALNTTSDEVRRTGLLSHHVSNGTSSTAQGSACDSVSRSIPNDPSPDQIFAGLTAEQRQAFERIVAAYVT